MIHRRGRQCTYALLLEGRIVNDSLDKMVDPTAAELQNFNTLADVADWVGVVDAENVPLKTNFLNELGMPTLIREVVLIKAASFEAAVGRTTIGTDPLNPAQVARIDSFLRACRLRCGLPAVDAPAAPAATAFQAPGTPSSSQAQSPGSHKPKLASVVDQSL